jgi:hypothetical protein
MFISADFRTCLACLVLTVLRYYKGYDIRKKFPNIDKWRLGPADDEICKFLKNVVPK